MSREFLFRGKSVGDLAPWIYGYYHFDKSLNAHYICDKDSLYRYEVRPETVGQFTEHMVKGINLFEDDIVRLEENEEGVDPLDKMTYYIVTWIKEWCMFSLLRVNDEYFEYKTGGIDTLDTVMFWTFPLDVEDIGTTSQHYLCGNIHDNPELLPPQN